MGVSNAVRNPGTYVSRTLDLYRALLTDPDRFYDQYIGTRGIKSEIALVVVVGVVGAVGNYLVLQELIAQFEPIESVVINQDVRFNLQQRILEPFIGAILLWIWYGMGMYLVGWLYTTIGTTYLTMKRAAWVLFPMLFANVIHTGAMVYYSFTMDIQVSDVAIQSRIAEEVAAAIWSYAAGETVVVAATLAGVLFALWAGYIGAYAIADVRDLSMDEAYKVAAVPTVGYALYIVYSGVTAL